MTVWYQQPITLPKLGRGFHLVTQHVQSAVPQIADFRVGILHLFIQHTSASLSINENADPDVPVDLEMAISLIAPENFPFQHTVEGPDDMPAHVKSSLLGSCLTIPISNGHLALGTWQGIYLCEFRNQPRHRSLVATISGEKI